MELNSRTHIKQHWNRATLSQSMAFLPEVEDELFRERTGITLFTKVQSSY